MYQKNLRKIKEWLVAPESVTHHTECNFRPCWLLSPQYLMFCDVLREANVVWVEQRIDTEMFSNLKLHNTTGMVVLGLFENVKCHFEHSLGIWKPVALTFAICFLSLQNFLQTKSLARSEGKFSNENKSGIKNSIWAQQWDLFPLQTPFHNIISFVSPPKEGGLTHFPIISQQCLMLIVIRAFCSLFF